MDHKENKDDILKGVRIVKKYHLHLKYGLYLARYLFKLGCKVAVSSNFVQAQNLMLQL